MAEQFHPVIHLPPGYEIYDFTRGYDPNRKLASPFGVGRYDEQRPGMYSTELFGGAEPRDIHVGVDIGGPVGTPVHAFESGMVFLTAYNSAAGDYGYTLITKHEYEGRPLYALHGHLSAASIASRAPGQPIVRGEVIAWLGDKHENGGWNPHLHFQLSWEEPEVCDMPGVVAQSQRAMALAKYPDPRLVLGPIY